MARRSTGTTTRPRGRSAPQKTADGKPATTTASASPDTAFVEALSVDFRRHGASAIARLREDDPVGYMKLCASVLPKALINSIDPLDSLSDEELKHRARLLAEKAGLGFHPDSDGAGQEDEPK